MQDWDALEADKNIIMNKHFTKGRNGHRIDKVLIHHNAGNLSTEGCYEIWQNRQSSAHYQVESDGTIGQLVWDSDTAWHASDFDANQTSIGIEHANNGYNPWTISDATLDNGAHLVAAICKKYNLGEPTWGRNVFPHQHFAATSCPGEIAGSQHDEYMRRAKAYYDQMMMGYAEPMPSPKEPISEDIDVLAREVLAGKYGNGEARRTILGDKYAEVQARVNEMINGSTQNTKSVDELAQEVIAGDWGDGQERANKLSAAGYSYSAVQARVNELLS